MSPDGIAPATNFLPLRSSIASNELLATNDRGRLLQRCCTVPRSQSCRVENRMNALCGGCGYCQDDAVALYARTLDTFHRLEAPYLMVRFGGASEIDRR